MQGLLWQTAAQVNPANLAHSDWSAVPKTLPVLSLAFVYQNVVPIICSSLEVSLPFVRCPILLIFKGMLWLRCKYLEQINETKVFMLTVYH